MIDAPVSDPRLIDQKLIDQEVIGPAAHADIDATGQLSLGFTGLVETKRAAVGATRAVRLAGRVIPYRFERTKRRTIGLVVDRNGLLARAPRWVPLAEVEAFIHEKCNWVLTKLAEVPLHEVPRVSWTFGTVISVLGRPLRITPCADINAPRLAGDTLDVPMTSGEGPALRAAVIGWLRDLALVLGRERAAFFAPRLDVAVPEVALSNARTQWGSCIVAHNGRVRVRLHWRLVQLPEHLVDYVVAHELAHIREMNHSPQFWRWVGVLLPHYMEARRELRRMGRRLPEI